MQHNITVAYSSYNFIEFASNKYKSIKFEINLIFRILQMEKNKNVPTYN